MQVKNDVKMKTIQFSKKVNYYLFVCLEVYLVVLKTVFYLVSNSEMLPNKIGVKTQLFIRENFDFIPIILIVYNSLLIQRLGSN